jgi:hypothetical protein
LNQSCALGSAKSFFDSIDPKVTDDERRTRASAFRFAGVTNRRTRSLIALCEKRIFAGQRGRAVGRNASVIWRECTEAIARTEAEQDA